MNHIYRLIYSDLTRTWVVVAEIARGRGKRNRATVGHTPCAGGTVRRLGVKMLAASLALIGAPVHALDVNALPKGGSVVAGSAAISQAANVLTVQQASQRAALNWQSFNIGAASTVNFVQPNAGAVALNRISGNEASQIYGKLNANGQVFFSNPNGMLFARGAQVNVAGILATTLNISNADFMAGNYRFTDPGNGSIRNEGLINALGSIALVGNSVQNTGQLIAATATLAGGNTVAVDLTNDGLIRARVVDPALKASIENSGSISAAQITLTAGQAKETLDRIVNNSGVIRATGLAMVNGEIVLEGGRVLNSGRLDASNGSGKGGMVMLLGNEVAITGGGSIDASGATGGGSILVGGDYQGKNPNIQNASHTYIGPDATLKADATQNGDGGKVIVWADDTTRTYGSISARGGAIGGNGGFIETSGKQFLDVTRAADASAPQGKAGTWLLDPNNISIQVSGPDTNVSGNPNFTSTDDSSIVTTGTIQTALNAGTSVIITTGNGGENSQNGDITVASAISKTAGVDATLTLNAHNNINLNASITSTAGQLNMVFNPDSDASGVGAVVLGGTTLNANGGTISAAGKTVNLSAGTATIDSPMTIGSLTQLGGVLSGTGTVTVSGVTTLSGGVMSGTGRTIAQGGMSITNSFGLDAGRVLENRGSATWTAGSSINLNAGSTGGPGRIENTATGVFDVRGDNTLFATGYGDLNTNTLPPPAFDNAGTFIKSAGTGVANINAAFNNSYGGTVQVQTGTLNVAGGGTSAGNFEGLGTLQFGGGTHEVSGALSLSNTLVSNGTANLSGTLGSLGTALNVTGGTANLSGVSATIGSLTQSGGVLSGTGTVTVSGVTTLSGGVMSGTGRTIAQGGMSITNSFGLDAGRVLENRGPATWTAGIINLNAGSTGGPGRIENTATGVFDVRGDNTLFATGYGDLNTNTLPPPAFDNAGTFIKSAGTGVANINAAFNNSYGGTVQVQTGTLNVAGGGTSAGNFEGLGTLQFGGGTHEVSGALSLSNTLVSNGTANLSGTLGSLGTALNVTGGTANLSGVSATIGSLTQSGGVLSGTGTVTVSGVTTLSGGVMSGTGRTIAQGGMSITNSFGLDAGRVLENRGPATWTAGIINLNAGSTGGPGRIENTATGVFDVRGDNTLFATGYGDLNTNTLPPPAFDNAGTFIKSAGTGVANINAAFNNSYGGTVQVQTGTLNVAGGGTSAGNFEGLGTLQFGGGTHEVSGALSLSNTLVSNGTANLSGTLGSLGTALNVTGGTANLSGVSATIGSLTQSGGVLSGTGTVTVSGVTTLSGGVMSGTGRTIAQGGMSITNSFGLDAGRVLENRGPATWTAGIINLNAGSTGGPGRIENTATGVFDVRGDNTLFATGYGDLNTNTLPPPAFDNAGTFIKSAGTGVANINAAFNNSYGGTVQVQTGTLNVAGSLTQSGTINIASGAVLQKLDGFTNASTGVLAGSGIIDIGPGNFLTNNGTISPGGLASVGLGKLSVTGNLTNTGTIAIDLGGYRQRRYRLRLACSQRPAQSWRYCCIP